MDDREITRMLKRDYSIGTEAFKEALFQKCLDVLGSDDHVEDLSDEQLDMLAAAGDPSVLRGDGGAFDAGHGL